MLIRQHPEEEGVLGEETLKAQRKRKSQKMFVPSAPRANRAELTLTLSGTNQLVAHDVLFDVVTESLKPRRQRQRKRQQTKDLMSRTMAVHVRYRPLYICFPSPEQQQCEMTTCKL